MGSKKSAFHAAYIDIDYLPRSHSTIVPFVRNLSSYDVGDGTGTWNNHYNIPSSSDFWTELVVGAFQPEINRDYDPDSTKAVCGAAKYTEDDNQCVVYYETLRDMVRDPNETLAHEVGHSANIEDNECEEGCIMWCDEHNQIGDHFCEKCLLEMRKDAIY